VDRGTPMLAPPSRRRQAQEGARAWRLSSSSIGKEAVDLRRVYHSLAGNRSLNRTSSLAFMGRRNDKQQSRADGSTGVGPGGRRDSSVRALLVDLLEQTGCEGRATL
jgi:hypothetical protein